MAWEFRPHASPRYTRSRRVNGRVVREYVGVGHVGALAAAEDAERRAERQRQRDARRADQESWEASLEPFVDFVELTERLTQAILLARGFHQHNHGSWRKRRHEPEGPAD